jgi:hypothetical protein
MRAREEPRPTEVRTRMSDILVRSNVQSFKRAPAWKPVGVLLRFPARRDARPFRRCKVGISEPRSFTFPGSTARSVWSAVSLLPLLEATFRIRRRRQAGRTPCASRTRAPPHGKLSRDGKAEGTERHSPESGILVALGWKAPHAGKAPLAVRGASG